MGLESLVNLGPAPTANTLNHLMLSCRALRDLWHSGCGLVDDKSWASSPGLIFRLSIRYINVSGKFGRGTRLEANRANINVMIRNTLGVRYEIYGTRGVRLVLYQ